MKALRINLSPKKLQPKGLTSQAWCEMLFCGAIEGAACCVMSKHGQSAMKLKKTMPTPKKHQTPKSKHYPDKTIGSETASKLRQEANNWSEGQRADLFEKGMQIIYGGDGSKKQVRT